MSALPDMSSVAASNSPVSVMLRKDAASLLESTTTALEAATVPAVMPSIVSSSASLMTADPIVMPPTVATPVMLAVPATVSAPAKASVELDTVELGVRVRCVT